MRSGRAGNTPVTGVAGLLAVTALGLWGLGGFQVWSSGAVINEAEALSNQLERLTARSPRLSAASLTAAQTQLAREEARLTRLQAALRAGSPWSAPPDDGGAEEVYFAVVSLTEALRGEAEDAGCVLPADFGFGFERLLAAGQVPIAGLDAGQAPAALAALHRQSLVIGYLVRQLLAAGPQALQAVEREPVVPFAGTGGRLPAGLFAIDPLATAALPGAIETHAVRLTFDGRTETLRSLLQTLAAFELPLVVRTVRVEPLEAAAEPAPLSPPSAAVPPSPFAAFGDLWADPEADTPPAAVPIVPENLSRFTLVIEAFDLVPNQPEPEGAR